MPMIPADHHLAVFAAIMVIASAAFLLEKTRIGAQLTGAVIAILLAIAASNLNIIPHDAPAYGFIFKYIVPALIPLFLFQADLRRLVREASRTTAAFILATIGTIAGVIVAALLLDLSALATVADTVPERREAAVVGLFASTYIGGSVNYAALGEVTGLNSDASFFAAATAADNLFSAVYLSILALLPGLQWLSRYFASHTVTPLTPQPPPEPGDEATQTQQPALSGPVTAASLCLVLTAAVALVAVTDAIVTSFNLAGWRYVVLTLLTLSLATGLPQLRYHLAGGFELGVALSFSFFAAIAAGANITAMINVAPLLIALVLILLTVHLLVLLTLGALCRLTLPELITASNAAVLGATTAPAMAATKGWHDQVTPGVLVGVLGYALGTVIGTTLFQLW